MNSLEITAKDISPFIAQAVGLATPSLQTYISRISGGSTSGAGGRNPQEESLKMLSNFLYMTAISEDNAIITTFKMDSRFGFPPKGMISTEKRSALIETASSWHSLSNEQRIDKLKESDRELGRQIYSRFPRNHIITNPLVIEMYVSSLMPSQDKT